jgi:predicted short-subunit dehydrogenase-like oxidoreductase (DUF2520 family)
VHPYNLLLKNPFLYESKDTPAFRLLMKVILIGTGNVATVLGRMLKSAGHDILQVIGRNMAHVYALATELDAAASTDFKKPDRSADICIVAVADDALLSISHWLNTGSIPVVHTAGSVSREVLQTTSTRYGVLYPLQSLRKEIKILPEVPFLIDGNTNEVISILGSLAGTMSETVSIATDYDRLRLHLAAVTTSNFMNHLFTLTSSFCQKEGVNFQQLLPLLTETVNRMHTQPPGQMQTGPAVRNDKETIQQHIQMLSDYPELEKVYEWMTKSIMEFHAGPKSTD